MLPDLRKRILIRYLTTESVPMYGIKQNFSFDICVHVRHPKNFSQASIYGNLKASGMLNKRREDRHNS